MIDGVHLLGTTEGGRPASRFSSAEARRPTLPLTGQTVRGGSDARYLRRA